METQSSINRGGSGGVKRPRKLTCIAIVLAMYALATSMMHANVSLSSSTIEVMDMPEESDGLSVSTPPAYACYPPRDNHHRHHHITAANTSRSIVYLKLGWRNLHDETVYSLINEFCSCRQDKPNAWKLNTTLTPIFYVGPKNYVVNEFDTVLELYSNTTACGEIVIGEPPIQSTNVITVVTTSYDRNFLWSGDKYYRTFSSKMNA
eukprot:scaffold1882_cov164-Alexandrium_tamarense.AAC.8